MYARRAAVASAAAHQHLKGLASFEEPTAGMFMWFKLTGCAGLCVPEIGAEPPNLERSCVFVSTTQPAVCLAGNVYVCKCLNQAYSSAIPRKAEFCLWGQLQSKSVACLVQIDDMDDCAHDNVLAMNV
eukprot:581972-Pelagomonas_calceolata.AAC.1